MTANVKIPVASAEGVIAAPLAAVYTERNSEGRVERFVYVQAASGAEKRNVKVGVADFFFAEIQEGLTNGEVVLLELPKEEREKKSQNLATRGGGDSSPGAGMRPGGGTNTVGAAGRPQGREGGGRTPGAGERRGPRGDGGKQ
jgi:hypothetical protein